MFFSIAPQAVRQPLTDKEGGPAVSLSFEVEQPDTSRVRLVVTGGGEDDPVWVIPFNRNGSQSGPVERRPSPKEVAAAAKKAADEAAAKEKAADEAAAKAKAAPAPKVA